MTPIYEAHARQVAWFEGEDVFDLNLNWIAFHSSGHIFSSNTLKWLGPLTEGSFQDRTGKVVAWIAGLQPTSSPRAQVPLRPLRPPNPPRPPHLARALPPPRPPSPDGGWSGSTWEMWVG